MFEAFIMVCSVYNFMDCRTFKDLNGPYVEMEKCEVRIEEMKFDIINNKLPFVVIKQKCMSQQISNKYHPWQIFVIKDEGRDAYE